MPSHSRSLHAKATEINVSLARKLAALLNLFRKNKYEAPLLANGSKLWRIRVDNLAKVYRNALTATVQSNRVYTCIYM